MKGLLLAGGHGTRLRPLTFTGNKHMLPIANKPMLFYGLEHLIKAGIKEIGIILGPIKEGVVESIGDDSKFGVKVTYIEQAEPKGLAHAVLVAEEFLDNDSFVMYLGDNLLRQGVTPLLDIFKKNSSDCVVGVTPVKKPQMYGVVEMKDGNIVRLVEKPKEPKSDLALIGIYLFNEKIFDAAKKIKSSWRNELEITDAIQQLLNDGGRVDAQFVQGWWKDTGKPEDLLEANQLVLQDMEPIVKGSVEEGAKISGKVTIGQGTVVRKGCNLRGPLIIGDNCEIGPYTYLGPYNSIGNNCKIISAEIENCIIMENTIIECSKRMVDSIIGKGSRITSAENELPKGVKLVLGDSSFLSI